MKICNNCKVEDENDKFVKGENLCKKCNNEKRKKKYAENKEYRDKIKAKQRETNIKVKLQTEEARENLENIDKYCKYCDTSRDIRMFRPKRAKCVICERNDGKEYRKSEHGKEKSTKWANNNKEQMQKLQSNWYQKNKPKLNKKYVKRYHNDPICKLKVTSKSRIWASLHEKTKKTNEYIGCDGSFYVEWIEFCFEQEEHANYTIENHGEVWELDHVVPIATFDLSDESTQLICFNWRNTMPLCKKANNSKKAKIDKAQIKKHYDNLLEFHQQREIQWQIL